MAKNRSLNAVKRRLGMIDSIIEQIIDENGHADVLEVGCGFGLPMLELKLKFKDKINIVGINKDKEFNLPKKALWEGVKRGRFYPWTCLFYEKLVGFPNYVNCDASLRLPFLDESFDFIYSIVSTGFFRDKILFLEETNRILKHNRIARIHLHYLASEPGYDKLHPFYLPYDNLCEIRTKDDNIIDLELFLNRFPCVKFVEQDIQFKNLLEKIHLINLLQQNHKYLELRKISSELKFGLSLVDSCLLSDIDPSWPSYIRSVYREI